MEKEFAEKVSRIWPYFTYLGFTEIDGLYYVILKTPLKDRKNDGLYIESILILEVDLDEADPEFSFSIVEEERLFMVFRSFCEKYKPIHE